MSLKTFSKFYFGHTITAENNLLDFDEGSGEVTAELNPGEYTLTSFAVEVQRALNDIGSNVYTVTVDRDSRFITIATTSNFSLLISTGTHVGGDVFSLMGFTGPDLIGAMTYSGNGPSGSSYTPQFILQDHIPSTSWKQASDASVNKAASGKVEVIKFGQVKFTQFTIKYATDIPGQDNTVIRNNPNGVEDLETFMDYITTKAPFEYMPDENETSEFETLILESNADYSDGTGFKLKELYDKNAPGYFETSTLKLRVIEDEV